MVEISLALAFLWAHIHSFTGVVLDVRDVVLVANTHARVALVQADFGKTWVILRVEPGAITSDAVVLGDAGIGDQVRVAISGPHVFGDRVDWSLCQPAESAYCQFGSVYESAPLSLDWHIPLSPSNEFIRYGHNSPHYSNALYWNTIVVRMPGATDIDENRIYPVRDDAQEVLRVARPAHARRGLLIR